MQLSCMNYNYLKISIFVINEYNYGNTKNKDFPYFDNLTQPFKKTFFKKTPQI